MQKYGQLLCSTLAVKLCDVVDCLRCSSDVFLSQRMICGGDLNADVLVRTMRVGPELGELEPAHRRPYRPRHAANVLFDQIQKPEVIPTSSVMMYLTTKMANSGRASVDAVTSRG